MVRSFTTKQVVTGAGRQGCPSDSGFCSRNLPDLMEGTVVIRSHGVSERGLSGSDRRSRSWNDRGCDLPVRHGRSIRIVERESTGQDAGYVIIVGSRTHTRRWRASTAGAKVRAAVISSRSTRRKVLVLFGG